VIILYRVMVMDVYKRLAEFCTRIGGRVKQSMFAWEFVCDVDPDRVLEHFDEFKDLATSVRGEKGLGKAYFGTSEEYFFLSPKYDEVGFTVERKFGVREYSDLESFASDIEREWQDYMRERGLVPDKDFSQSFSFGSHGVSYSYIEATARLPYSDIDKLDDVGRAMIGFDREVFLEKLREW